MSDIRPHLPCLLPASIPLKTIDPGEKRKGEGIEIFSPSRFLACLSAVSWICSSSFLFLFLLSLLFLTAYEISPCPTFPPLFFLSSRRKWIAQYLCKKNNHVGNTKCSIIRFKKSGFFKFWFWRIPYLTAARLEAKGEGEGTQTEWIGAKEEEKDEKRKGGSNRGGF